MSGATDPGTRTLAAAILRLAGAGQETPHLVVLDGPLQGVRLPLAAEQTLGRGQRSTLRLPDPRASRLHARLRGGPGGLEVEDLGSKNGLRVNGRRARGPVRLRPGDLLTVGGTRLRLGPAAAPDGRRPAPAGGRVLRAAGVLLLAAGALLLWVAG